MLAAVEDGEGEEEEEEAPIDEIPPTVVPDKICCCVAGGMLRPATAGLAEGMPVSAVRMLPVAASTVVVVEEEEEEEEEGTEEMMDVAQAGRPIDDTDEGRMVGGVLKLAVAAPLICCVCCRVCA